MTLGEKIKEARKNMGLSQEQLAEKLCVSRQAITKWESDRGIPDITNLKALARLLDVSIDYLLDDGISEDCGIIKESIDWSKYPRRRWFSVAAQDAVVLEKYPDAVSICELTRKHKRTKGEAALDEVLFWIFDMPGDNTSQLYNQIRDMSHYYLVELSDRTILVNVTDEYIISCRMLSHPADRKFEAGNNIFTRTARKITAKK